MVPVYGSSNIESAGYEDGSLCVRFKGGSVYRYDAVTAEMWAAFQAAPSKGAWLARHVTRNPAYPVRKLPPEQARRICE